jgi:hypothetical protein
MKSTIVLIVRIRTCKPVTCFGLDPRAFFMLFLFLPWTAAWSAAAERKTENVILITYDGLRFQELFGGAQRRLINADDGGVKDVSATLRRFDRDTPRERREALLPFFWQAIARRGQVFGDPDAGSPVRVTNGRYFSYPGYNEILSGAADVRIDSNDKRPNRNVTVLEWLHRRGEFAGRVGAFCSWDVFPFIINARRSGVYVNAGWQPLAHASTPEMLRMLNRAAGELPRYWHNMRYDLFTFEGAIGYLRAEKPRVLYVAFGETDDWAHAGRYDLYLDSAGRTDDYVRRLWEAAQQIPQYAGKTSLLVTTDHGRGDTRDGWKSHGADLPGSEFIWIAVMGPDTAALGVREHVETTQSQAAATVAALLGLDFASHHPQIAAPLPGVTGESELTTTLPKL